MSTAVALSTADIATELGTTARTLRQFLRSSASTYTAVGSGARYEFTDSDLPTLRNRFLAWNTKGKVVSMTDDTKRNDEAAPSKRAGYVNPKRKALRAMSQQDRDELVWMEEEDELGGPVEVPNVLTNRAAREQAWKVGRERAERLNARLLELGIHVSQQGRRAS